MYEPARLVIGTVGWHFTLYHSSVHDGRRFLGQAFFLAMTMFFIRPWG